MAKSCKRGALRVSNIIEFKDKKLEKEIKSSLNLNKKYITTADIETLNTLFCSWDGVDLTGLEHAKKLKTIIFTEAKISNIMTLADIKSIRKLEFKFTDGVDLKVVTKLPELRELEISWNYIDRFILPNENYSKVSYINMLNRMVNSMNFTTKQKIALEKYIFSPSKENGIKAVKTSSKATRFVKDFISEDEILDVIKAELSNVKVHYNYVNDFLKLNEYQNISEDVIFKFGSTKAKKIYIEKLLSNN